jgi:hypothetical protein
MIAEISSLQEVELFMKQLISEGTNAHPDDDFNDYINTITGHQTYTAEQAAIRNSLMAESFIVCDRNQIDIYDLMQEIYLTETGMDQFIPKPSQITDESVDKND